MDIRKFVVTRQRYWSDGRNVVEVAQGGTDYANADALCGKYPGEFEEFIGMKTAVEKAIEIAKAWQADEPDKEIEVATGCTHGMTMEFEGTPITDEEGIAEILQEAEKFDEKLPRCACGELLPPEGQRWHLCDDPDAGEFCSESCCEKESDQRTPRWTRHYNCTECDHHWVAEAQMDSYDEDEEDTCPECGEPNTPDNAEVVFPCEIEEREAAKKAQFDHA